MKKKQAYNGLKVGDKVRLADTEEARKHAQAVNFPILDEVGTITQLAYESAFVDYPSLPHVGFYGEGWATDADHLVKVND